MIYHTKIILQFFFSSSEDKRTRTCDLCGVELFPLFIRLLQLFALGAWQYSYIVSIPDNCHFWYATIFFRLVKSTQKKVRKFVTKIVLRQNSVLGVLVGVLVLFGIPGVLFGVPGVLFGVPGV